MVEFLKHKGGRPKEKGSLRDIGKSSIAIDAKTKRRIKVLAGSLPLYLWLRRHVDKQYTQYVLDLGNEYEILGIDENDEPILGKPLVDDQPKGEPVEEETDHQPCDLTDIENWKKDYHV